MDTMVPSITRSGIRTVRTMRKVLGAELQVGDRIAPWGGRATTIAELRPYTGPIECLAGARIALFGNTALDEWTGSAMTIEAGGMYDRIVSEKAA